LTMAAVLSLLAGQRYCDALGWEGAPLALHAKVGFTAEAAVFEVDGQLTRQARQRTVLLFSLPPTVTGLTPFYCSMAAL
jgi:hypothetical protein